MKQELIWLLVVMIAGLIALLCSRMMRTVVKEAIARPKEKCTIQMSDNKVTVTSGEVAPKGVKHGGS